MSGAPEISGNGDQGTGRRCLRTLMKRSKTWNGYPDEPVETKEQRRTKMLGNIGLVWLIAGFIPHDESPDYTSVQCLQNVLCTWDVLGVSKMKRDQDQEKREAHCNRVLLVSTLRLRTLNNEAEPLIGLGSSAPQPYPCLDTRGRYRSSRRSSPCGRQGLLDCSPRRRVLEIVERLLACRRCRQVEAPHALHTSLRVVCRAGRAVGI